MADNYADLLKANRCLVSSTLLMQNSYDSWPKPMIGTCLSQEPSCCYRRDPYAHVQEAIFFNVFWEVALFCVFMYFSRVGVSLGHFVDAFM